MHTRSIKLISRFLRKINKFEEERQKSDFEDLHIEGDETLGAIKAIKIIEKIC